jgi:hypothetical protein
MRNTISSGTPSFTDPSEGSDLISERNSLSSTKYGPSVNSGRTTHEGIVVVFVAEAIWVGVLAAVAWVEVAAAAACAGVLVLAAPWAVVAVPTGCGVSDPGRHPTSSAAPVAPNRASTSLRLRTLPTCLSSLSILYASYSVFPFPLYACGLQYHRDRKVYRSQYSQAALRQPGRIIKTC